jgi:hypothetical protein
MRPAPFFALVEVLLGELLALIVDVDTFDVVTVEPLGTGVDDPAVVGAPEIPLISAATVALKVPVMPVRVNLAENASAKAPLWVGFGRLLDVNRIK